MTRRVRTRYRQSLVALPALYLVAAVLLGSLTPEIDAARAGGSANVDTARDVLAATATGMIAFTGFVLSGVLLVVQFAAGQYSPRLVLWFRRDTLTKHAIVRSWRRSCSRSWRCGGSTSPDRTSRPT